MEPSNVHIRAFSDNDTAAVAALWRDVLPDGAPHNEPLRVIQQKTAVDRELFLVAEMGSEVVGTVIGGYDGHRGWVYSLAVDRHLQRRGIARMLVQRLEEELSRRGCLKVNLQVRAANAEAIAFYEQIGYDVEDRISMGKRLYDSDPDT